MSSIFNHQNDQASTITVGVGTVFGDPVGSETDLQQALNQIDPSALTPFPYVTLATETNKGGSQYATTQETIDRESQVVMVTPASFDGYIQSATPPTETKHGTIQFATSAESQAETLDTVAITPAKLDAFISNRYATETVNGIGTIAVDSESKAATNDTKLMTPYQTIVSIVYHSLSGYEDATETDSGVLRIATKYEINRDFDNLAVTPSNLQYKNPTVDTRGLVSLIDNTSTQGESNVLGFTPATISDAVATQTSKGFVRIVDNFTTTDSDASISASRGKFIQDDKIGISGGTANSLAITKLTSTTTGLQKRQISGGLWIYENITTDIELIDSDGLASSKAVLNAYPVGSYFITTDDSQDPEVLFGGRWRKSDASGRTFMGTGTTTDTRGDQRSVGSPQTGGNYNQPLSVAHLPRHQHQGFGYGSTYWPWGYSGGGKIGQNKDDWHNRYYNTSPTGGNSAHNNIQPYIAVNIWYRFK